MLAPGDAAVGGHRDAAVVAHPDPPSIAPVEDQLVLVGVLGPVALIVFVPVEDRRPATVLPDDHPHRVLALRHGMPVKRDVLAGLERRGYEFRIGRCFYDADVHADQHGIAGAPELFGGVG